MGNKIKLNQEWTALISRQTGALVGVYNKNKNSFYVKLDVKRFTQDNTILVRSKLYCLDCDAYIIDIECNYMSAYSIDVLPFTEYRKKRLLSSVLDHLVSHKCKKNTCLSSKDK